MYKTFTKSLFILSVFIAFAFKPAFAQTITIHNFVPGNYTPGSSIAVPFTISGTCIKSDNVFNLYLADASGNILPGPPIGTFTGFYATFVNGTIPQSTTTGTYTLVVKSTDPAQSAKSAPFTVTAGQPAVTAKISGPNPVSDNPTTFGSCAGQAGSQYTFNNSSTVNNGSSTPSSTAVFYNESTQSNDTTVTLAPMGTFTANTTNYTINVQTVNGTSIATEAYMLVNNVVNNNFGATNTTTVCIVANGGGLLTYNLDVTSANGLQYNFPGNTYQVKWGDGVTSTYTICQLLNSIPQGQISHVYTTGSCSNNPNNQRNSFEVDIQPQSPYCGPVGTQITSYAKVMVAPTNSFTFPPTACTGSSVTFTNTSDPGQDPNSTNAKTCTNLKAQYTWSVDGQIKLANASLATPFIYIFYIHGKHNVTLTLQNGGAGVCSAPPITQQICIQDPPTPAFTLPSTACLSNPVPVTDQSVLDETCSLNTYLWTVSGPPGAGAVTFNNSSRQPQFQFSTPGVYQVTLSISSVNCAVASVTHSINVDGPPIISMSPAATVCGTNSTYYFGPSPGPTKTTISGTTVTQMPPQPPTYTWTVTGDPGYSFANGTTANSQYPQITFTSFAKYTISVTETNSCSTAKASQDITFQNAPSVNVSASPNPICPGSSVTLTGTISNNNYTSLTWIGSGQFSAPGSLTTNYTPTLAEINAGQATVTLDLKTPLLGQCADIPVSTTINIYPVDKITSAAIKQICTNTSVNYNIKAIDPGSSFTWTATLTSGAASGFAVNGSGTSINDIITNNAPGDAIVTYTITPTDTHGCIGPPSTLQVTVKPLSTVTASPAQNPICSGSPANINLTPSVIGTTYTWTSTTTGNIIGNTQQPTPITSNNIITDNLNNQDTIVRSVTYKITPWNSTCPGTAVTIVVNVQPLPVVSNPGQNTRKCNITTYTLNGNTPPVGSGKWTVASGQTGITFADDTKPSTIVSGLVPSNTYQFTWTITIPGCQLSTNTVTIIDDAPSVGGTTSGAATVCSGSSNGIITLSGQLGNILRWEYSIDNGANWTTIPNTTASQQYFDLTTTTQYRAVVQNGLCNFDYSTVTIITVNPPPVQAYAGKNQEICNTTTYTLQGNDPAPYHGKWTMTAGPPGAVITDDTLKNTTVTGLSPGNIYQFKWTITAVQPCPTNSSVVTIADYAPTVGGTTSADATVCAGSNSGTITLSGQVGKIITWESSTDGGNTFTPVANSTSTSLQYLNLSTTTQFRVRIQSGTCLTQVSSVTTITVNQPAVPADAGKDQTLCGATTTMLKGNQPPAPFTGIWSQTAGPLVTIMSPNSAQTRVNGLSQGNDYTFVWTIQAQPPCANSSNFVQIHDASDVTPSFIVDNSAACGSYTANFTNTSTSLTGTSFLWDFGDGSPTSSAVSPSHQFAQRNDGKDTAYTVTLSIVNNCVPRPPFTMIITVRPKDPIASILPDQLNGCSPFVIRVANKSPGNNTGYVFYLYDGPILIQQINKTDKSTAVFNPVTSPPQASKIYTVYMVATGFCNNTTESTHVPITVSPPTVTAQMFIQGSLSKGCAPLAVTFVNNSSGGDSYFYTIYDVNNQPIAHLVAGSANYSYTFNNIGTYFVSITGVNGCSSSESPKTRVDVYALPQPQFDADIKTGCKQITVNFTNLTPDDPSTPATSLSYVWDFGDNTQATGFTPPPHVYNDKNSTYTVTLTATNSGTGCSNVIAKSNFIVVHSPAGTDFTERPDSATIIPNYTFSFRDQTTGNPIKWIWSFGDGKSATSQNPTHTYPDTGLFKVILTATSQFGCDSTKSHFVRINGVPGQLFLPNAFEPDGSNQELRIFMAKGSGIKQWHMQIFNNYSQLVWETTRLDNKGAPVDGWDGTFKGVPVKQGVYVWQVSATFINGTEWKGNSYNSGSLPKRTGVIHLIR